MKLVTQLRDSVKLSRFESDKVISDPRLKLMTDFIELKYNYKNDNWQEYVTFVIDKLKEHFHVNVSENRLKVFYIVEEEIANKKSEVKFINY